MLQPLDLAMELADLSFPLVALSPLANVAAKPFDLDQDVVVTAVALTGRARRRIAAAAAAAIADLVPEARDLAAQRVDRLLHLRGRRFRVAAAVSAGGALGRILAASTLLVSGRARGHGIRCASASAAARRTASCCSTRAAARRTFAQRVHYCCCCSVTATMTSSRRQAAAAAPARAPRVPRTWGSRMARARSNRSWADTGGKAEMERPVGRVGTADTADREDSAMRPRTIHPASSPRDRRRMRRSRGGVRRARGAPRRTPGRPRSPHHRPAHEPTLRTLRAALSTARE